MLLIVMFLCFYVSYRLGRASGIIDERDRVKEEDRRFDSYWRNRDVGGRL